MYKRKYVKLILLISLFFRYYSLVVPTDDPSVNQTTTSLLTQTHTSPVYDDAISSSNKHEI